MALEAHDIWFGYRADEPVISGCSLAVEPGERVALTAPSGAGKTTLCRVLAGYLSAWRGSVEVDGAPLGGRTRGRSRCTARPVQLIWQHPEQAFDPMVQLRRALEEVLASSSGADARQAELKRRFGIDEAWLTRRPHELSGGELMRLNIVRVLTVAPRYLICDEMTAMLDAVTQARVWHEVMAVAQEEGMGILLVSHSPSLVDRVATRVVTLDA